MNFGPIGAQNRIITIAKKNSESKGKKSFVNYLPKKKNLYKHHFLPSTTLIFSVRLLPGAGGVAGSNGT